MAKGRRRKNKRGSLPKARQVELRTKAKIMFLEGATIQKISRALGVDRTTLWHWRAVDGWDDELRQLSSIAYEKAKHQIITRRLQDFLDIAETTRSYVQTLLERADEAEQVPLMNLVRMIETLKELLAREIARLEPEEKSQAEAIEVEWQA